MCLQPDTAEAHVGLPASYYFTHRVISQDILQCSSLSITVIVMLQWWTESCSVSFATVVFHLLLEDWSIQYRGKNGVRASTLLFFSTHFLQNIHTIKMAQIPVLSSVAGSNWAQVSHRYLMEKKKIMSHLKLLWSGMWLVSPYSSCLQYICFHLS